MLFRSDAAPGFRREEPRPGGRHLMTEHLTDSRQGYGHDQHSRDQLEAMLLRWGLEPVILDQLPTEGQTVIEKLESAIVEADFGVVLATPDDAGYRTAHQDEKAYRARQNVALEMGMLLAKVGRQNVAVLLKKQENQHGAPHEIGRAHV